MPGPIDQKLDTFFAIVNTPHNNPAGDAAQLINQVFCRDGGANPDWVPRLGITEHGNILGPRFLDVAQVQALFAQLFKSFPLHSAREPIQAALQSPWGFRPRSRELTRKSGFSIRRPPSASPCRRSSYS